MAHRASLGLAAALMVASCGGGGGSDTPPVMDTPPPPAPTPSPPPPPPPPPASNAAPELEVEARISVAEGQAVVLAALNARDEDGTPLTFSVSGPDSALFSPSVTTVDSPNAEGLFENQLTASGLDFEQPSDADGDNIYRVTVTVSDGTDSASQDVEIAVTDRRFGDGFTFDAATTGLIRPIQTVAVPGTSAMFLIEQNGRILFSDDGSFSGNGEDSVALDIRGQVSNGNEQGLLGMTLSPSFASDRTLYVNLTNGAGNTEIRQYRLFANRDDLIDPSTETLVLLIPQPLSNHNAGWIGFDGDGNLLVPTGDGGGANDPQNNAQDPFDLLGKVLRIDPTGDDFPSENTRNYAIPPDNPFANGQGGAPEVFALGLRNPFRCDYAPVSDTLYIAEVGQGDREEVNALRMATGGGTNFGWPLFEGLLANRGTDTSGLTAPLAEYAHGSGPGRGQSISGGFVAQLDMEAGQGPDEFFFVFGDFISGNLWVLDLAKIPEGGTVDAATFEALAEEGPVRRIGGLSQVTNVSAGPGNTMLVTTLDGRIVTGAGPDPAGP